MPGLENIRVVDSHTEGEPTRVIVAGGPDLGSGSAAERLERFRGDFDHVRSAVVNEPRGSDAVVGAILLDAVSPDADAQVIFFNNVGFLNMCIHGTIGVGETLAHMGRISGERVRLETPVGEVELQRHDDGSIAVENVVSYRHARDVEVETARHGRFRGDVAWGGNWFFLVNEHGQDLHHSRIDELTRLTRDLMASLEGAGITGRDGGIIDHIELFGPPAREDADSRNFVLCPGGAYDRSPCGTGTSAKLACLAADGKLADGVEWRQESIIGSRFVGSVRTVAGGVVPTVRGRAWITAESTLMFADDDPFARGIVS